MELKGCKINVLGDSITEGHGSSDRETKVWWRLLGIRDGADMYGDGIGGTRIAKQLTPTEERWDKYFRSRVAEMRNEADVVIVFGGTNDYGHGDAPLGHMSDRCDETFYGALHMLYTDLKNKFPNAYIMVMTPLHRLEEERTINERGIRNVGRLCDYVSIIKEVAAYYSIPVLDLYTKSGLQPDLPLIKESFMPDGLHPNDAGYEKIYNMVKNFLAAEFGIK